MLSLHINLNMLHFKDHILDMTAEANMHTPVP